jgi:hypothetical protein
VYPKLALEILIFPVQIGGYIKIHTNGVLNILEQLAITCGVF